MNILIIHWQVIHLLEIYINVDVTPWKYMSVIPPNHLPTRKPGIGFHLPFLNKRFSSSGPHFAALRLNHLSQDCLEVNWDNARTALPKVCYPWQIIRSCFEYCSGFSLALGVLSGIQGLKNLFCCCCCYRQTEWRKIPSPTQKTGRKRKAAHDTDKRSEKTDA